MLEITKENLELAIQNSFSLSHVCRKLGYNISSKDGASSNMIRRIQKYLTKFGLVFTQDKNANPNIKYKTISKICPVCSSEFTTLENYPRKKTTCSSSCANTYFRSGPNNPNFKIGDYTTNDHRKKAFKNLPHICGLCGWDAEPKILQVHHIDNNHSNNELSNLKIVCPTCHYLEHFKSGSGWFTL